MHTCPIAAFYAGRAPDYLGRTLADIRGFDHERMEDDHSYIQVLFPNDVRSPVTPHAPTVTPATVAAFAADGGLRAELAASLDQMLDFYGLEFADGSVRRRPTFAARGRVWLTPGNHNHLRVTRILKCLTALGLADRAEALRAELLRVAADFPDRVTPRTVGFWQSA